MCGEKCRFQLAVRNPLGSPPHVRGKGVWQYPAAGVSRITPACAGKRRARRGAGLWSQDHPRMCGEKCVARTCARVNAGSPPHVRGKAKKVDAKNLHQGITPACAGKSATGGRWQDRYWDHPRMCGEKSAIQHAYNTPAGSPPHVRGKAAVRNPQSVSLRITPACAGKSKHQRRQESNRKDHPRMCGEKSTARGRLSTRIGSPPHVRGKAVDGVFFMVEDRITPACAGKRRQCRPDRGCSWDHPRMCGEKLALKTRKKENTGSPPHVRGKAIVHSKRLCFVGITPACAGKSFFGIILSSRRWDHPRMCGEKH